MRARLFLLAALAVPTAARAEPARDMATVCAQHPSGDDLVACGRYYMDAYNREPNGARADEHLYNAGVMFGDGAATSAAVTSFNLLRKQFPNSKLAPRALARTGKLYAGVAMYELAAAALEEYARKYAGEKDAFDALSDAVYYRKAIGDHDKAIELTKYFVRTYGAKRPAEAAAAWFALAAIYDKQGDRDRVLEHLRDYIRQYGSKGGTDRLVIAYAKIGETLWEMSCPSKLVDGVCVRVERARKPAVCESRATTLVAVKRDKKQLAEALQAFADATKLYERAGGKVDGDAAAARYYYARAALRRVDADAEPLFAATAPTGPKLKAWLAGQTTERGKLVAKYERVVGLGDVATAIAAAARIARLSEVLGGAIVNATTKKAECDALAEAAAPIRHNARITYEICLARATEVGWFDDEGGRSCERALGWLDHERFPRLSELTSAATYAAPVLALERLRD